MWLIGQRFCQHMQRNTPANRKAEPAQHKMIRYVSYETKRPFMARGWTGRELPATSQSDDVKVLLLNLDVIGTGADSVIHFA
jgi:hypothetical protein